MARTWERRKRAREEKKSGVKAGNGRYPYAPMGSAPSSRRSQARRGKIGFSNLELHPSRSTTTRRGEDAARGANRGVGPSGDSTGRRIRGPLAQRRGLARQEKNTRGEWYEKNDMNSRPMGSEGDETRISVVVRKRQSHARNRNGGGAQNLEVKEREARSGGSLWTPGVGCWHRKKIRKAEGAGRAEI
ncbi:hypothetical protein B0H19DRAFT_1241100 [Mycena capillaripes]|nr:hypothetical protein B0H19DRAFT_1241100 [Mycena capillaripes]